MDATEDLCRNRFTGVPGRIRCIDAGASCLGRITRVGGGCLLLEVNYQHPSFGGSDVVMDVFGLGFQARFVTRLMFRDGKNAVVSIPSDTQLHPVPARYTLTPEPVAAVYRGGGSEILVDVVGFSTSGFLIETNPMVSLDDPASIAIQGTHRDHLLQGKLCYERNEDDCRTFGVAIDPGDRIQFAHWSAALRDVLPNAAHAA